MSLRPGGDFVNHREWGRRLLDGEFLYNDGLNTPYPPFWAVAHAPLATLSLDAAYRWHLTLGLAALAALLRWSHRATGLPASAASWLVGGVLLVLSRPILRDVQDGGANLILTALVCGAVAWWVRGCDRAAGASLGLAVALKCTAGLFVAYFLWKRQWRVAAYAVASAVVLSLTPILWQGLPSFRQHVERWLAHLRVGREQDDPRVGVLGPEEVRNLALRPSLGRVLLDLPGQPLSPGAAGQFVRLALVGLFLATFWRLRGKIEDRSSPLIWRECAAVLLLMLLLSPITWLPHLVAAIPAVCLLPSSLQDEGRWRWGLLAVLAVVLVFLRGPVSAGLVGESASRWLERLGLTTGAIAALLWLTLQVAGTGRKVAKNPITPPETRGEERATAA